MVLLHFDPWNAAAASIDNYFYHLRYIFITYIYIYIYIYILSIYTLYLFVFYLLIEDPFTFNI